MSVVQRVLSSSVGRKMVVALTGLALLGFVLGHMAGNLQIFAGQEKLNAYAKTLADLGPLLWAARIGLLAVLVVHVGLTLKLARENRAARPQAYARPGRVQSTTAARTMLVTGSMIVAFVAYHLAHFTVRVTHPEYADLVDAAGRHDTYTMVVLGFSNPFISGLYVLAMALLAVHLNHGIASVGQTLGLSRAEAAPAWRKAALALSWIIFLGNTSIPVAVLSGLVTLPPGA